MHTIPLKISKNIKLQQALVMNHSTMITASYCYFQHYHVTSDMNLKVSALFTVHRAILKFASFFFLVFQQFRIGHDMNFRKHVFKLLMSMENPIAGQHLIMTETEIHIKFNYEDQYCYT